MWPNEVKEVKFYPQGDRIINTAGNWVQVRLTENGQQISPSIEPDPGYSVNSIDVSPDGKYIAATAGNATIIYDAKIYEPIRKIDSGLDYIRFSPDSRKVFGTTTGHEKNVDENFCIVLIWDIKTGRLLKEIKSPTVPATSYLFDLSEAGNYFAIAQLTSPGKIWIYDLNTYEKVREYSMEIEKGATIYDLHFSKDGNFIGSFSSKNIIIWNLENGLYKQLSESEIGPFNFSYYPNEIILFSKGYLRIYNLLNNINIYTYSEALAVSHINMSKDKKYIIGTGSNNTIKLIKYKNQIENVGTNPAINNYSIYPNPIDNNLIIDFYIIIPQRINISIDDLTGKSNPLLDNTFLSIGQHHYSFPLSNFTDGMYYVNIKSENINISEKIIINR
jgi:WD40 repeat protein